MRVLVTGSAGRIGRYVVRDLVATHLGGLGPCRRAGSADVRRSCPRHLSQIAGVRRAGRGACRQALESDAPAGVYHNTFPHVVVVIQPKS